jgi:hypothetical protein
MLPGILEQDGPITMIVYGILWIYIIYAFLLFAGGALSSISNWTKPGEAGETGGIFGGVKKAYNNWSEATGKTIADSWDPEKKAEDEKKKAAKTKAVNGAVNKLRKLDHTALRSDKDLLTGFREFQRILETLTPENYDDPAKAEIKTKANSLATKQSSIASSTSTSVTRTARNLINNINTLINTAHTLSAAEIKIVQKLLKKQKHKDKIANATHNIRLLLDQEKANKIKTELHVEMQELKKKTEELEAYQHRIETLLNQAAGSEDLEEIITLVKEAISAKEQEIRALSDMDAEIIRVDDKYQRFNSLALDKKFFKKIFETGAASHKIHWLR